MIVCLRVDERLIHGQVAMTWTKELKLNGLVVASDEAASNGCLLYTSPSPRDA